ncbi:hypothetical protein AB4Z09_04995 [Rhodococcus sp. TAF43]|uniref:hypothetical protein n=1 Tax=unclassified Rhodococcus (in: high G+C Gram-positive bacteria) TaxID=192944 RepID=UPI001582AE10|nr:hypothetical protein [Rhodococcus sp. W8901]QKT09330.1 hypothetical protein HUN07_24255 [Rhodococcus sp. W8901]
MGQEVETHPAVSKEFHPEHLVVVDELPRSSGGKLAKGVEQCACADEPGEYYRSELLRDCAESDALEATSRGRHTTADSGVVDGAAA